MLARNDQAMPREQRAVVEEHDVRLVLEDPRVRRTFAHQFTELAAIVCYQGGSARTYYWEVEEYIRHGIGAARPYLYGDEATILIIEALGGSVVERIGGHVEARIGDSMLVVETRRDWPATQPRQCVYVYVGDVDATYAAAVREGAISEVEPMDKPYAERACTLRDTFGNTWYVATYTGPHAP